MKSGWEKRRTLSALRGDEELASLIRKQQNLHFTQRETKLEQVT
jgi:hypothetical protein